MRIYDLAKHLKIPSKELVEICDFLGMKKGSALSSINQQEIDLVCDYVKLLKQNDDTQVDPKFQNHSISVSMEESTELESRAQERAEECMYGSMKQPELKGHIEALVSDCVESGSPELHAQAVDLKHQIDALEQNASPKKIVSVKSRFYDLKHKLAHFKYRIRDMFVCYQTWKRKGGNKISLLNDIDSLQAECEQYELWERWDNLRRRVDSRKGAMVSAEDVVEYYNLEGEIRKAKKDKRMNQSELKTRIREIISDCKRADETSVQAQAIDLGHQIDALRQNASQDEIDPLALRYYDLKRELDVELEEDEKFVRLINEYKTFFPLYGIKFPKLSPPLSLEEKWQVYESLFNLDSIKSLIYPVRAIGIVSFIAFILYYISLYSTHDTFIMDDETIHHFRNPILISGWYEWMFFVIPFLSIIWTEITCRKGRDGFVHQEAYEFEKQFVVPIISFIDTSCFRYKDDLTKQKYLSPIVIARWFPLFYLAIFLLCCFSLWFTYLLGLGFIRPVFILLMGIAIVRTLVYSLFIMSEFFVLENCWIYLVIFVYLTILYVVIF